MAINGIEDFTNLEVQPNSVRLWIDTTSVAGKWFVQGMSIPHSFNGQSLFVQLKQVQVVNFILPNIQDVFRLKVDSRVQAGNHFSLFTDFKVEIPENSVTVDELSSEEIVFFFEPNLEDFFINSNYEVLNNNVQDSKKSNYFLKVDKEKTLLNPTNLPSILSSSIVTLRRDLDSNLFSETQDSNYTSEGWIKGRYQGSQYTRDTRSAFNLTPTLADPFFGIYAFTGSVYELSATTQSIFQAEDSAREKEIIFHRNIPNFSTLNSSVVSIEVVSTTPGSPVSCTSFSIFGGPSGTILCGTPVDTEIRVAHRVNGTLTAALSEIKVFVEVITAQGTLFPGYSSTEIITLTIPQGSSVSNTYSYKSEDFSCTGELFPCNVILRSVSIKDVESDIQVLITDLYDFLTTLSRIPVDEEAIAQNRTYLYKEVKGFSKFIPLINSQVYSFKSKNIVITDSTGLVIRILRGDYTDDFYINFSITPTPTPSPTPTPTP